MFTLKSVKFNFLAQVGELNDVKISKIADVVRNSYPKTATSKFNVGHAFINPDNQSVLFIAPSQITFSWEGEKVSPNLEEMSSLMHSLYEALLLSESDARCVNEVVINLPVTGSSDAWTHSFKALRYASELKEVKGVLGVGYRVFYSPDEENRIGWDVRVEPLIEDPHQLFVELNSEIHHHPLDKVLGFARTSLEAVEAGVVSKLVPILFGE